MNPFYDIIIVGAGISGLSAAIHSLERKPAANLLILESGEAEGGRARSRTFADGFIWDEGAHWFHGGNANPFFQWANKRYDLGPMVEDTVDQRMIVGDISSARYNAAYEDLTRVYEEIIAKEHMFNGSLHAVAKYSSNPDVSYIADFMASEWMASDNAKIVAARDFFEDPLGPGGWQLKRGMGHVAYSMKAEAINRGAAIHFNKVVKNIFRKDDLMVVNTSAGEVFSADHVIVTVSAGVLKSRNILFDTDVEIVIDKAISGLHMGHLAKGTLRVKEMYFHNAKIAADQPIDFIKEKQRAFIHVHTAGEDTLTVFSGGKRAEQFELMNEHDARNHCFEILDEIALIADVSNYLAIPEIYKTAWAADPHFLGSYSICEPGFYRQNPLDCGRLTIAGEAFLQNHEDSAGQITGAWRSGQIAAQMIKGL